MRKKAVAIYMLVFTLIILPVLTLNATCNHSSPKMYIEPQINEASVGETFTINVNISDASLVYSWDAFILWNPAILNVSAVKEGAFLKGPDGDYSTYPYYRKNETKGELRALCTLFGEPWDHSASGNGTLVSITFLVEKVGECALDLYDSHLFYWTTDEIDHDREGGYFNNKLGAQVYMIDYNNDTLIDFYGSTTSNSTVGIVCLNRADKSINFTVEGSSNTASFCNVSIPRKMLDCPDDIENWMIFLNTTNISGNCTKTRDDYYTYIYIPYNHSTNTLTVTGTWVVPEFPTPTIFLLLTIISSSVAIGGFLKKAHSTKHRRQHH
jgi:hypothetical protein